MARLHVIFFDSTLCQVSTLLKAGVMQIVLAMIEAESVDPRLILDDPVAALRAWSEDPTLRAKAPMCNRRRTTALDLQSRFLDDAGRFAARGGCDGVVPRAAEIIALWADTLDKLRAREFPALAGRLDWVAKRLLLEALIGEREDLNWKHPTIKHLDQLYSSLDPDEGLFWTFDRQNLVEKVVSDEEIDHFVSNPPEDTRAWTRAMLLRRGGMDRIAGLDWDFIRCAIRDERGFYEHRTVNLANPLDFTRESSGRILDRAPSFDAAVGALQADAFGRSTH
jgi:proteasome accessory factor A